MNAFLISLTHDLRFVRIRNGWSQIINAKNPIAVCVLIVGMTLAISGCEKVIDTGGFRSLRIGQTKDNVLVKLIEDPKILGVEPVLRNYIAVTRESLDRLQEILDSPGLILRGPINNNGIMGTMSVRIEFNEIGIVKHVESGGSLEGETFGFVVGQSRVRAMEIMANMLEINPKFHVFNFLPTADLVILSELTSKDSEYLKRFDNWAYHTKGEYSKTTLNFDQGHLSKIIYSWSPIELP